MRALLMVAAVALVAGGCSPERLRPGPPRVTLEARAGATVFSPDTLPIAVVASDPNGLDSLTVTILGTTESISTGFDVEVATVLNWVMPDNLPLGDVIPITARARDLTGQSTTVQITVTVVERPGTRSP
ncbi:MAG TPA: hypothetical protein VGA37_10080 [Gemmatimonadales bacterium]